MLNRNSASTIRSYELNFVMSCAHDEIFITNISPGVFCGGDYVSGLQEVGCTRCNPTYYLK